MRFQCQLCNTVLDLEDCQPGELVVCGKCGKPVQVPATSTSPGAILGDFVIKRKIGEGGMGFVYLAHQISLDRDVAIKVLLPSFADDASFIEEFINEARSAASVNHPNIVQAYAVSSDQRLYYFAMEFVDGLTLKQMLEKDGKFPAERVLAIAEDMVSALSYAWTQKKLVHRDIKPDNIMINSVGQTKLADLGLARKITETNADGTSELFGTPQYVAPELLFGAPANAQSDIYSLGGTLYNILTGNFPYDADNPEDIVNMHLFTQLVPIFKAAPGTPAPLAALIESMLAKRPCHRYSGYDELEEDIKRVKNGQMPQHMPPPDAQTAIDSELPDPMAPPKAETGAQPVAQSNAPKATGKRKMVFSTGKQSAKLTSKKSQPVKLSSSTSVKTEQDVSGKILDEQHPEEDGEKQSPNPPQKSGRKGLVTIIIVVVLLIAGGAGAFFFLKSGKSDKSGSSGNGTAAAKDSGGKSGQAAIASLKGLIAKGTDKAAIAAEIARLTPQFAPPSPLAADFLAAAAPFVETQLNEARQPVLDELTATWEKGVLAAKVQAEQAKAEEAKKAKEAAQKAEEEAQKKKAEQEAKAKAEKLEETKDDIRAKMLAYTNDSNFTNASLIFSQLESSPDENARTWAKTWLKILDRAEKFYLAIKNSGKKLAGTKLPVLASKHEWLVEDITFDTVKVTFSKISYRKGKESETIEEKTLDLTNMLPPQLFRLAAAAEAKGALPEGESKPMLFSYLLSRGAILNALKAELEKIGGFDFAIAEIDKLNSNDYFNRMLASMKSLTKDRKSVV